MSKKLPSEFDYNNDFNIMPTPPTLKARELDLFMSIIKKMVELNSRTIDIPLNEVFEYVAHRGEDFKDKMVMLSQFADKILKWNIKYTIKDKNGIRFYAFVCFEKMNTAMYSSDYAEFAEKFFKQPNRTVRITAQEDFFEMIINKKFGWTRADIKEYIWLSSKYTKKIYQLLKQWRSKGITQEYEWNEFKELLNIPKNYTQHNIDQRILEPAIKELTEQHNLFENSEDENHKRTIFEKLNFHKIKNKQGRGQGGKVEKIYFTFTPQREQTKEERLKLENTKQAEQIKAQAKQIEKIEKERDFATQQQAALAHALGVKNEYQHYVGRNYKNSNGESLKIMDIIKLPEGGLKIEFKNQETEDKFYTNCPSENHLKKYLETLTAY